MRGLTLTIWAGLVGANKNSAKPPIAVNHLVLHFTVTSMLPRAANSITARANRAQLNLRPQRAGRLRATLDSNDRLYLPEVAHIVSETHLTFPARDADRDGPNKWRAAERTQGL